MSSASLSAWWQLLRTGNVFTAASNVVAGFVIATGGWQPVAPLLALILASALLYEAGMVLNDVFDAKLDARERPERPLPSGRIAQHTASIVGWGLLIAGVAVAVGASFLVGHFQPVLVAGGLALCIVAYDGGLKNTPLGPWTMGGCRLLNVMLGASVIAEPWDDWALWYAAAIGFYTVGLTYFSQRENESGWKLTNTVGTSFVIAATFCICFWYSKAIVNLPLLIGCFLAMHCFFWIGLRWLGPRAIEAGILRSTVGRLIVGFILLDAIAVYAHSGLVAATIVLALLVPTWIASRFAPMT